MSRPTTISTRVKLAAVLATGMLIGVLVGGGLSSGANATGYKVTICHSTNSFSNPYNLITVDVASIVTEGHSGHDGPVFDPVLAKGTWGDIIPAFDFGPGLQYWGMNVVEGGDILAAGCSVAPPPTTEPPTTTTTTIDF